ncbi:MAG: Nif3-like dinuclear metal center hexameric protein, partial [Bacteroidales bacterium]|nr:Nif3-like dinuclear metal center hexameric protein [Bacteroidales bacterium]
VPLSFQEEYDNSGLQIGDPEKEISSALITLDVTENVVAEAISQKCDLIVSHHPLIFHGLKKITGRSTVERMVMNIVKNNLAVYSAHTNLDAHSSGVSYKLAEKLELINLKVLLPLNDRLLKLVTFIPVSYLDKVRSAIFDAGAGVTGNYDQCGFTVQGKGSFRGNEASSPFIGEKGKIHFEEEIRFETILYAHLKDKVVNALLEAHPYEEVAYDLYPLLNNNISEGMGVTGETREPLPETDFLKKVSVSLGNSHIRFSGLSGRKIRKVAVCGGAGSALLNNAIASGSDAFVTADIKYHTFLETENQILLVDAGHYETEKFALEILYDLIIKKFPKFAVRFSEINTNPINYL